MEDSSNKMLVWAVPKALMAVTLTLYGKVEKTSGKRTRQRFLWSGSLVTSSDCWLCLERRETMRRNEFRRQQEASGLSCSEEDEDLY